jgi:hypothetical protein
LDGKKKEIGLRPIGAYAPEGGRRSAGNSYFLVTFLDFNWL